MPPRRRPRTRGAVIRRLQAEGRARLVEQHRDLRLSRRLAGLDPEFGTLDNERTVSVDRIRNPLTGHSVRIGGPTFHRLVEPRGPFVVRSPEHDRENRQLILSLRNVDYVYIDSIWNPSPPPATEERRSREPATPALREALRRILVGDGTWYTEVYLGNQALANAQRELMIGSFWAQHAHIIRFGPYTLEIPPTGAEGDALVHPSRENLRDYILQHRVLHDNPLHLPYSNIDLNAGSDEQCLKRFLGGIEVEPKTMAGLCQAAARSGIAIRIWDVLGEVMHFQCRGMDVSVARQNNDMLRSGILYNGHIYPLRDPERFDDDRPKLNRESAGSYNEDGEVVEQLQSMHAMIYKRNRLWYTPNGVYSRRSDVYKEWMGDMFRTMPLSSGWNLWTLRLLKHSALSLYMRHRELTQLTPTRHIAIDMSTCYYRAFLDLAQSGCLLHPDLYACWEPIDNLPVCTSRTTATMLPIYDIEWYSFYALSGQAVSSGELQDKFGLLTNIVSGRLLQMLLDHGVNVRPFAKVRFQPLSDRATHRIRDQLLQYQDAREQKKAMALVIGMCGRTTHEESLDLEMHRDDEAQYYIRRYGMWWAPGRIPMLKYRKSYPNIINHFIYHLQVIHHANFLVLRKAISIRDRTLRWPIRICVDSLTYGKTAQIEDHLRTEVANDEAWHLETCHARQLAQRTFRNLDPLGQNPEPWPWISQTFYGPPGTGKTTRALAQDHDLGVAPTNKRARSVRGMTLHALFQARVEQYWFRKPRSTILPLHGPFHLIVDEAQSVSRRMMAAVVQAMITNPQLKVTFAMDLQQLTPVGEAPVDFQPFHGELKMLCHNYRNDAAIVLARKNILAFGRAGVPPELWQPLSNLETRWTMRNIAFTNKTCAVVNRFVRHKSGIEYFSDEGALAICNQQFGHIERNQLLQRRRGHYWLELPDGEWSEYFISDEDVHRYFSWAFCLTAHRTLGDTITDPLTIWDINIMQTRELYTAFCRAKSIDQITVRPVPPRCDLRFLSPSPLSSSSSLS